MPFFTRLRRASHFLLRGQEKVTKEKATPMQRSPGILPSDFAKRFRGWRTVHPCTDNQLARIPASHPAGTPPPLRRRIGASFTAHPAQQNRAEADADSGRRQTSSFSFSPCGRRCRRRMRGALDVALALRCGNCPRWHASAWKTWERRRPRRPYFKSPRRRLTSTPKVSEPIFARHLTAKSGQIHEYEDVFVGKPQAEAGSYEGLCVYQHHRTAVTAIDACIAHHNIQTVQPLRLARGCAAS